MKHPIQILFAVSVLVFSCKPTTEQGEKTSQRNKEAREDQAKFDDAMARQNKIELEVFPNRETTPINAKASDDSADDPAFWYNNDEPFKSIVYGTNKKGGIYAYDLEGVSKAYYEIGKVNNIDVRQNFIVDADTFDILGGSNRTYHSLELFQIDSLGGLSPLFETPFVVDESIDDVYGFCLYQPNTNQLFAIINGKNGVVKRYELTYGEGEFQLGFTDSLKFDTQIEGMVADDENKTLFVGEEEKGVWAIDMETNFKQFIETSSSNNNVNIAYDIEGLALYKADSVNGYLLASVQGGFNYAVFNRTAPYNYINSFKVTNKNGIDGTEETDGIDIYSGSIGAVYPHGLLTIQDGFNYQGDSLVSQNFKYVALEDLLNQLKEIK